MWKIENLSKSKVNIIRVICLKFILKINKLIIYQGGVVGFEDKIRLRALRNGKYLAIMPIKRELMKKNQFSIMKEEDFVVTLQKNPNDWTVNLILEVYNTILYEQEFTLDYKGKIKE